MYRIALCDDELQEIKKTENLLEVYRLTHPGRNLTVCCFTSVDDLLVEIEKEEVYDLLLMDIYMPGRTGIEGSKELRRLGVECPIIFMTTSMEHALAAFNVNAVQYLVKPVEQERFTGAMNKAFESMMEESCQYVALRLERGVRRIALRDIVFCESHSNYQYLALTDGTETRVRMTLMELYTVIGDALGFAFVGSAYLVNLSHIDTLSAKEIVLDNQQRIGVPRGSYPALKEQYFKFYCSEKRGVRV